MTALRVFDLVAGVVFVALFGWLFRRETAQPLRRCVQPRADRIRINAAVGLTAALTFRLTVLPVVCWVAARTRAAGRGVLPPLTTQPLVGAAVGILMLDYTTYLWHRLNHVVPRLWRFHLVHHTDLDLDVTTATRFHPGELLLSVLYRAAQVRLIGVGPAVLLTYEAVSQAATAFHHSNWRLPLGLERVLVRVVVTPRMHGIHHSMIEREASSNWSVIFSWWDRAHGTLGLDVPQEHLTIGLPAFRDATELTFGRLIALPFGRPRSTWSPDATRPDRPPAGDRRRLAA
jgi:sterol desaturase/sphingolipid hydroxylase (fatty acid hydroxylase superfamily)